MQGCWDAPNASIGQLVRRTETRLKPAVHFASGSPAGCSHPAGRQERTRGSVQGSGITKGCQQEKGAALHLGVSI